MCSGRQRPLPRALCTKEKRSFLALAMSESRAGGQRIVVANPGSMVETPIIAAALQKAGALRKYMTPFGSSRRVSRMVLNGPFVSWFGRVIDSQLKRRQLPEVLTEAKVDHVGALWDGMAVV